MLLQLPTRTVTPEITTLPGSVVLPGGNTCYSSRAATVTLRKLRQGASSNCQKAAHLSCGDSYIVGCIAVC